MSMITTNTLLHLILGGVEQHRRLFCSLPEISLRRFLLSPFVLSLLFSVGSLEAFAIEFNTSDSFTAIYAT